MPDRSRDHHDEPDPRGVSLWAPQLTARFPQLVGDRTADVVVVGAGLAGLLTATLIERSGADVIVLDRSVVGGVATRNSTAKISALQGTVYREVRRHRGPDAAAAVEDGSAVSAANVVIATQAPIVDPGFLDAVETHFGDGKFVTGVLASLEVTSGEFSWCVAGHPPPLLIRRGRVVKELDRARGLPFGIGPASSICVEQLEPGDRILLYTDGVTEARDLQGELFGLERLVDTITRVAGDDPPPRPCGG
jgi:hypothetical protein